MEDIFKSTILFLLTPECYDEFFVKFNFLDVPCLKLAISKGLGLAIILGSLCVKVPQILKITANKSATGISIFGVLLELFAITANVSYSYMSNFPFSAWGEGLFLAVQQAAIVYLVLYYSGESARALSFLVAYAATMFLLVSGATPIDVLWCMQVANVPVIVSGKMIQALANFKNKSTGQLSAATIFMLLFGSLARIFTSIQETGDMVTIITYVSASSTNAILAGQILYYRSGKEEPTKKKGKKATKATKRD